MLKRKGFLGCLRKNSLIAEMEEMRSYDVSILNSMQSLSAVQTTTGNCLHCLQDARIGLFNPEEREEEQTFLVATESCEIHKFRGLRYLPLGPMSRKFRGGRNDAERDAWLRNRFICLVERS